MVCVAYVAKHGDQLADNVQGQIVVDMLVIEFDFQVEAEIHNVEKD